MKLSKHQMEALAYVIQEKRVVHGVRAASFDVLHQQGLVRLFPGIRGSKEIQSVWAPTRRGMYVHRTGTGEIPTDGQIGLWGLDADQRVRAYNWGWDEYPTIHWYGDLIALGNPFTRDVKRMFDPHTGKCVNPVGMYPPYIELPNVPEMEKFFLELERSNRRARVRDEIERAIAAPDAGEAEIWGLPADALEAIAKIIQEHQTKEAE